MRMLPAAIIATLALSLPAVAGPFEKLDAPVGGTELAGPVELPLYADADGGAHSIVVLGYTAEAEDADSVGIRLQTSGHSAIAKGTAEKLGLRVKKVDVNGADREYAVIPKLWLGADRQVVVTDLTVAVSEKPVGKGLVADGVAIDLAQLGLAWAVRPSTGTVHLAPAAQGGDLLAAVGGTQVAFRSTPERKVKYGKDKLWVAPAPYVMDATVGGEKVALNLDIGGKTHVSNDVVLPDAARKEDGDRDATWQPLVLGDLEIGNDWVWSDSSLRVLSVDGDVRFGGIGYGPLAGFDIAVDPAGTIALAAAGKQARKDPRAMLLARAESALDECLNPTVDPDAPADAKTEDEADDTPPAVKCKAQYGALADASLAVGDLDGALEAWTTVVGAEDNARECGSWLSYGDLQLTSGDLDGAIASFSKASAQYHAWWDMEAFERLDAQKSFDNLSEDEQDAAETRPQADSCHVADGKLAAAWFAKGDSDKVAELYDANLDLDPGLAVVYGNELLLADQVEAAHGPWRMAEHLTLAPSLAAKAGLGRLFSNQGDWESASANYERARLEAPEDATVMAMWVTDLAGFMGPDEALTAARKWMGQRPDSLAARYAVAVAAVFAGKSTDFVTKEADGMFEEALSLDPADANLRSTWSRYLVVTDRAAKGLKVAEALVEQHPDSPEAWLALARAQAATGKGDIAASTARAVATGAMHPGYALLRGN